MSLPLGVEQLPEIWPFNDLREIENYLSDVMPELKRRIIQIWNTSDEVPSTPEEGTLGLVTYGPAAGNGLYLYQDGMWQKLSTVPATPF